MEVTVNFITEIGSFIDRALSMLDGINNLEILISGTFDNLAYRDILNRIITIKCLGNCKMIIPYISGNGIISRTYVNKIIKADGEVRLNSRFTNNFIVIGDYVFIISFNYRHNPGYGLKSTFEGCILTNAESTVKEVKRIFMNNWHNSLPLRNA